MHRRRGEHARRRQMPHVRFFDGALMVPHIFLQNERPLSADADQEMDTLVADDGRQLSLHSCCAYKGPASCFPTLSSDSNNPVLAIFGNAGQSFTIKKKELAAEYEIGWISFFRLGASTPTKRRSCSRNRGR
eukprot:m.760379 g.760379  ORF g.760379 m.760379 type:complete len:132 (-) comp59044_c0_seq24:2135-2530(-)